MLGVLLHGAEVIGCDASAADKRHADLAAGNRGVVAHLFLLQAEYGEAGVSGGMAVEQALQVSQNRLVTTAERAQFRNVFAPEFVVPDSDNQCIHRMRSIDGAKLDAVLVSNLVGIRPRVGNDHLDAPAFQFAHQIGDLAVADVRAVFLEGDALHADRAARDVDAVPQHQPDHIAGGVARHVVVDPAPGEDDLRVIADLFRLVGQIVRVNADAMPADHARAEGQEVPLAARCLENLQRVDIEAVEDDRKFIDQGDVQVALGVLDDLGCFGHLQAGCREGAGGDDAGVERIDRLGDFRRGAAGDLPDLGQRIDLVARVDALRAVAAEEIDC